MPPDKPPSAELTARLEQIASGAKAVNTAARNAFITMHIEGVRFPSGLDIVVHNLERDIDQLFLILRSLAANQPGRNDSPRTDTSAR